MGSHPGPRGACHGLEASRHYVPDAQRYHKISKPLFPVVASRSSKDLVTIWGIISTDCPSRPIGIHLEDESHRSYLLHGKLCQSDVVQGLRHEIRVAHKVRVFILNKKMFEEQT